MLERHRKVILGEVVTAVNEAGDARIDSEDIVQDVFEELVRCQDAVGKAADERAYVRHIAGTVARRSVAREVATPEPMYVNMR